MPANSSIARSIASTRNSCTLTRTPTPTGSPCSSPGRWPLPCSRLTGVPLLTVNVVVVLALILSVGLATGLAFAWTGSVVASLLAGRVFAHVPNRMDHLGTLIVQMGCRRPGVL